jgi:hypothetical protein
MAGVVLPANEVGVASCRGCGAALAGRNSVIRRAVRAGAWAVNLLSASPRLVESKRIAGADG